jgi:hypothetical protein
MMEADGGFRTSVDSLLQLAVIRFESVVLSLLSALDGLARVSAIFG